MTLDSRAAGVLLHPTSLPGSPGIGDLDSRPNSALVGFLDWAQAAGLRLWQILPLTPPAAGDSPYSCLSAFAGNPLLISPAVLVDHGLLDPDDLANAPATTNRVDFPATQTWKGELLRRAWQRFPAADDATRSAFRAFCERERSWLQDWVLFVVLRRRFEGRGWWDWDADLARREPAALRRLGRALDEELDFERFVQFCFDQQWSAVRLAARERGIEILGDLPIYVALDSADVWTSPQSFQLDSAGQPTAVAGVPPDYFSADGQLWGNPLYDWKHLAITNFDWWVRRIRRNLDLTDRVRLDHFRGFAAYWSVPASATTARAGSWQPGPGRALFDELRRQLGALPLIAEDLGVLTEEVHQLRRDAGIPCMRVLQFGFDELDSVHAPHRVLPDTLLYTGTHDNTTTVGWWAEASLETRERYSRYSGSSGADIAHELWRLALTSTARWAIAPIQDFLRLDAGARMNTPGVAEGNWAWRLEAVPTSALAADLRALAEVAGRPAHSETKGL